MRQRYAPVKPGIVISLCAEYNGSLYVDCIIFPTMIAMMPFSLSLITCGSSFDFALIKDQAETRCACLFATLLLCAV